MQIKKKKIAVHFKPKTDLSSVKLHQNIIISEVRTATWSDAVLTCNDA